MLGARQSYLIIRCLVFYAFCIIQQTALADVEQPQCAPIDARCAKVRECLQGRQCGQAQNCCFELIDADNFAEQGNLKVALEHYRKAFGYKPTSWLREKIREFEDKISSEPTQVAVVSSGSASGTYAPPQSQAVLSATAHHQPSTRPELSKPARAPPARSGLPASSRPPPSSVTAGNLAIAATLVPTVQPPATFSSPRPPSDQAGVSSALLLSNAKTHTDVLVPTKPVYKRAWFWGLLSGLVATSVIAISVSATWPRLPNDASRFDFQP